MIEVKIKIPSYRKFIANYRKVKAEIFIAVYFEKISKLNFNIVMKSEIVLKEISGWKL